ncbi:MAG: protease modulator HflC [Candidatus Dasytiphilus stammeri]
MINSRNIIILLIFSLFFLYSSFFTIQEGQRGILLRFSKIKVDDKKNPLLLYPGLHFKIPLIETVKYLDSRIQTIDNQAEKFITKENNYIIVDSYIKWRINNFRSYYLATGGSLKQAEKIIKNKIDYILQSQISSLNIRNIVTNFQEKLNNVIRQYLNIDTNFIHGDKIKKIDNKNISNFLGIEVIDVRIKKINFPLELLNTIYNQMQSDRKAVAKYHRIQGKQKAEKLLISTDYKVSFILAKAERQARIIRGDGDAIVTKMFATTFRKNPEFYLFIRSLQAYKNIFNQNKDLIILDSANPFFHYLVNPPSK